jgi:hypothetical protein
LRGRRPPERPNWRRILASERVQRLIFELAEHGESREDRDGKEDSESEERGGGARRSRAAVVEALEKE